jgi:hypothetical protein
MPGILGEQREHDRRIRLTINADLRPSVTDRFGRVADTPGQERKFPVARVSARKA